MLCNHHEGPRAERPFACSCVDTFNAIVAGEEIPKLRGYCAIVREAARHPEMLEAYASDLITHDRAQLTDYAGPFLWVLRDWGTVLLVPSERPGSLTVDGLLVASFGPKDGALWFWFDGRYLAPVTPTEAKDLISDVLTANREACRRAA